MRPLASDDSISLKIAEMYSAGKSLAEIASVVGLSEGGVSVRLQRIDAQCGGWRTRRTSNPYLKLRERGLMSLRQVALDVGHRDEIVLRCVQLLGIVPVVHGKARLFSVDQYRVVKEKLNEPWALRDVDSKASGVADWEAGWAAGVIDGEGSVALTYRRYRGRQQWHAGVDVGAIGGPMMCRYESILRRLNLDYSAMTIPPRKPGYAPMRRISVLQCASTWALCRFLLPFLSAKRQHAELMIQFSEQRSRFAGRPMPEELVRRYADLFVPLQIKRPLRMRGEARVTEQQE